MSSITIYACDVCKQEKLERDLFGGMDLSLQARGISFKLFQLISSINGHICRTCAEKLAEKVTSFVANWKETNAKS